MAAHPAMTLLSPHEAGIDFLRVTGTNRRSVDGLREVGIHLAEQLARRGYEGRQARLLGYQGFAVGALFAGRRDDGAMLQLSGAAAGEYWREPLRQATNVTRLDLQVTIAGGEHCQELAEAHQLEAIDAEKRVGRPVAIQLLTEHRRGQTLYLGKRSSEVFRRCYDKHQEKPKEYEPGMWRYEVEYKGETALVVARALGDRPVPDHDVPPLVYRQFAKCGVTPLFSATEPAVSDRRHYPPTDDEQRLHWYRKYVSPSFQRMVAAGKGEDALRAIVGGAQLAG